VNDVNLSQMALFITTGTVPDGVSLEEMLTLLEQFLAHAEERS